MMTLKKPVPPFLLQILNPDGGILVIVHNDGRIEYGPNYTPDDAADIFWTAIGARYPRHARRGAP